jgi:hypothetical protein
MQSEPGDYVVGVMMAILGLIGLFLAAGAADSEMYVFGLSLAGFAGLFIFGLVKRFYDRQDEARALARERNNV